jgi:hypothetical protein
MFFGRLVGSLIYWQAAICSLALKDKGIFVFIHPLDFSYFTLATQHFFVISTYCRNNNNNNNNNFNISFFLFFVFIHFNLFFFLSLIPTVYLDLVSSVHMLVCFFNQTG